MKISKEELLKIVDLSDLKIREDEVEKYLKNLEDILNFTEVLDKAPIKDLDIAISSNEVSNVFRKDEIVPFDNMEGALKNAEELEQNMIKVPKVIQ